MHIKRNQIMKLFVVISVFLLMVVGCRIQRAASSLMDEGAQVVQTRFPTEDVVVADVVVTDQKYGADNEGIKDSTIAIVNAINDVARKGGGTVYLPAGKYLVTRSIDIKPFVTLRGDYQDPDEGNEYGTVIIAKVASSEQDLPALFALGGSSGVMGLTIYYPEQDIDNVKPYPFTFYVPGNAKGNPYYMLQSIVNCTVINGCKGLGATVTSGVHEMMTVENFKGTFLHVGAEAYNQADVGTWKNIRFNNDYWARAGADFNAPPKSRIDAYTRQYGTGLVLGDLEWTQFANVSISDCNVGVQIVPGKRIEFAGSLFGLVVENCNIGLKVDKIDQRWGMVVANSRIEGSQHSIYNFTSGYVKVAQTDLVGPHVGRVIFNSTTTGIWNFQYDRDPPKPIGKLYNVVSGYGADKEGKQDASQAIQEALNDARKFGGGVVYLEAGFYKVTTPLEVPANVELRGASSVANRDQSGLSRGTVLLSYYGDNAKDPDSDVALITLDGDNAGVRGLRIVNPLNSPSTPGREGMVKPYPFAIRGKGANVYAVNIGFLGSYNGIDFRNCDSHYIKKVVGTMYNIGESK